MYIETLPGVRPTIGRTIGQKNIVHTTVQVRSLHEMGPKIRANIEVPETNEVFMQ